MKKFVLINDNNLWYGVFPKLEAMGVKHAVTTRLGGHSALFKPNDLNMSFNVGDDKQMVMDNRIKVAKSLILDITQAIATRQTHTKHIQCVDYSYAGRGHDSFQSGLENTDGLITNCANLPLLLFFADCVPIILFDPVKHVLSVVHAGWRGTTSSIAATAIEKMHAEYSCNPIDCHAFIGPSIGPCCYEVDNIVADAVVETFDFNQQVLTPKANGKWHLDLWKTNALILQGAGLLAENIITSDICTIEHNDLFFSHRKEQGKTGRISVMASL